MDLERLLEEAFGSVDPPEREAVPGFMVQTRYEAEWWMNAYGGKRYDAVRPPMLSYPSPLIISLGPQAFAYYIGGVALLAAQDPESEATEMLANSFSGSFIGPEGSVNEGIEIMSLEQLRAVLAVLRYAHGKALEWENESDAESTSMAISNLEWLLSRRDSTLS